MRFSLRSLLAVILLAAIFTAAFNDHISHWLVVGVVVGILIVGMAGVMCGVFQKHFWIPFCLIGWLYLAIAFTPLRSNRLVLLLPSTHATMSIWSNQPKTRATSKVFGNDISMQKGELVVNYSLVTSFRGTTIRTSGWEYLRAFEDFGRLLVTMHAVGSLLMATVVGVIASVCVRRSSKLAEH